MFLRWGLGLAWVAGLIGAVCFIILYGSPRRYLDRTMAWHLFWTSVIGGLQYAGLLLAAWSLVPLFVADWVSVGIIYWRIGLLIATRRQAAIRRKEQR